MLIEFTVGNFLSFKEKQTFSMQAASIRDLPDNVMSQNGYKLLRSTAIYGANSSGKSNLIKAMAIMRHYIFNSVKIDSSAKLNYSPFLLNENTKKEPSFFEIVLLIDQVTYRYGFTLTAERIIEEWLYKKSVSNGVEHKLFERDANGIDVDQANFKEGISLEDKTKSNSLFISIVDLLNGEIAKKLMLGIKTFNVISGLGHEKLESVTQQMLHDTQIQPKLLAFYQDLQLGFDNITTKDIPIEQTALPSEVKKQILSQLSDAKIIELRTTHSVYNNEGEVVGQCEFDMDSESDGTHKIIDLSGPCFNTLDNGGVLVVDELDAKLHPLLTKSLIRLFNNPEKNPKNAQLIFATHDTNLLSTTLMRRDQIWFAEKNNQKATELYSLVEIKGVRNDSSLEKDYLRGRYG
ncbi:MAG: ATP-binding protein, partial [Mucinivorans sp.]